MKFNSDGELDPKISYIKSLKGQLGWPDSAIREEIRQIFGVKATKGNQIFNVLFKDQCGLKEIPAVPKVEKNQDDIDVAVESEGLRTIEQVMAFCKIDAGVWESKGFNVRQGTNGLAWSARFGRKIETINADDLIKEFIARAGEHAPKFFNFKPAPLVSSGNLLEISVPDLHLAKLCWGKETRGRDYDIKIASQDYKDAVRDLFSRARGRVGRILLPVGNDMFNSDNMQGTTTKGTPQATSEDSRWPKTFMTGCEILTEMIEELASEVIVDVVLVAGNHDKERTFYLGAYLQAWFRNHPNVTVNNQPTPRQYYSFGNTLIGFTHGNEEKPAMLPGLMAREAKQEWAACKFYQWHLGHLHHEITRDIQGVVIRFLTSLCPPDEWHASKGFVGSVQAAEAFEYHPTQGLITTHYHNV